MTGYENTIDWDEYWREERPEDEFPAGVGANGKADLLERFFERVDVPDSLASFGCGPADAEFELAARHPEMRIFGSDSAKSVVEMNRERAAEDGLENVEFAVDHLPAIETDRRFDLVYCYATLHYVADIERAIENLYARVRPSGHLVCNFPTQGSHELLNEEENDNEHLHERFGLVAAGENLLAPADVERLLDAEARDYWDAVDADEEDGAHETNACVSVPKRED